MTRRNTKETIVRLLSSMADGKEIRQYLKYYGDPDHKRLAIIKVGGAILANEIDQLASALSFLHGVGLIPVVIHGAGPQIERALDQANIPVQKKDGLRITPPQTLALVRQCFLDTNMQLLGALDAMGVPAASLSAGVFAADYLNRDAYGEVGEITAVNLSPIEAVLAMNKIPVLMPMGETAGGQLLNVNADQAANSLIASLKPHKIIFLTETGGILNGEGKIIDSINLAMDYKALLAQDWLQGGMRLKFKEIADLLSKLPLSSSVSITRPAELAKELFTHTGSGTLIRRGEAITCYRAKVDVPKETVKKLIEQSFKRRLVPDYLDRLEFAAAYVSEAGRALAIISHLDTETGAVPWLDKFAVCDEARGEGLARSVWRQMTGDHDRLMWRSRVGNPINNYYFEESDGHIRRGEWQVFWRGKFDFDQLLEGIEAATIRSESFEENS
jgi:bifunctional N-acetylglutamate synthase/kinase